MPAAPIAAVPEATDAAPAKPGRKKKVIVIAAVLSVLLAGGGAAWFMNGRAAPPAATGADGEAEDKGEEGAAPAVAEVKPVRANLKHAPTFVPLDPFTVNLADRESERFAQVGVSLELTDAKAGELLTAYMPAIRNNILLALGSKTAAQLMERDGKVRLATEIRREALRPLGFDIAMPPPADSGEGAKAAPAAAKDDDVPIRAVHFTNFIIQ
jgi:flagellar FliL protein